MSELASATDGTYATTCWECSTCCGALATVRNGCVTGFGPNRNHPYSKDAFCIKGIRGAPGTYSENQVLLRAAQNRRSRSPIPRGYCSARPIDSICWKSPGFQLLSKAACSGPYMRR